MSCVFKQFCPSEFDIHCSHDFSICEQRRFWSDCAFAQSDQSLRCSHICKTPLACSAPHICYHFCASSISLISFLEYLLIRLNAFSFTLSELATAWYIILTAKSVYWVLHYCATATEEINELKRQETYRRKSAPNEDSNQSAHLRRLIRIFILRMKKL